MKITALTVQIGSAEFNVYRGLTSTIVTVASEGDVFFTDFPFNAATDTTGEVAGRMFQYAMGFRGTAGDVAEVQTALNLLAY